MAKFAFQAVLSLAVLMLAVAAPQSGPKVTFFNYSGMQATVHCVDNPPKILEAGDTCIVPLTSSDQSCIVTLKDGEHASATVDKLFPSSTNSGHSISVDINDTFLFFAVEDAPHHQYVSFLDSQNEQIRAESNSDLLLWWAELLLVSIVYLNYLWMWFWEESKVVSYWSHQIHESSGTETYECLSFFHDFRAVFWSRSHDLRARGWFNTLITLLDMLWELNSRVLGFGWRVNSIVVFVLQVNGECFWWMTLSIWRILSSNSSCFNEKELSDLWQIIQMITVDLNTMSEAKSPLWRSFTTVAILRVL